MGSKDDSGKGKKNPWGNNDNKGSDHPSWGSGGGDTPPDIDEMLRKAQDNLRQVMPGGIGHGKLFILALVAAIALWMASGFYIITPGEQGVIQRFGAHHRTQIDEGLGYHVPWPVEILSIENVSEVRKMQIGFIEHYGRNSASGTKQDIPDESLMLTSDANIIDIDLEVQWHIKSAEDYLFNIYDQENTIKKVAESAIREVVGQTRMFPIITKDRTSVANRAKDIMMENLDEYKSGVEITQVLILQAEVHPDVHNAFQDVQSAKQDAENVQNHAKAYREDILPKAHGQAIRITQQAEAYKQSVTARATGDAERFNAVYESYLSGKDVTRKRIYIETMEDVLENAQKIIMDEGASGSGVVPYLPLSELKPASGQ